MNQYRPILHIAPKRGWINDPNGFAYFQGRYHIYCQYNPKDTQWGPMHWLHFASDDLLHFEELDEVMKPDQPYDHEFGCFSGSAIEKDGKLYVLYTGAVAEHQRQCLAISEDGQTFTKYESNPIIDEKNLPEGYLIKDFRDPKVFEKGGVYYVMLAARHKKGYSSILLYKSEDLLHYEFVSVIKDIHGCRKGGMVECPDLFFDGDRCALLYSLQNPKGFQSAFPVAYQIGRFHLPEGRFEPLGPERALDDGFDCYATQTLQKEGKTYLIAWQSSWDINHPTAPEGYVGQLTLVKEVQIEGDRLKLSFLKGTPTKRLVVRPLKSKASLRINNLELILEKKRKRVTLLRKDMDEPIIGPNKKPIEKRQVTLNSLDPLEIEYSFDNSCVEIRLQKGEAFLSLLNLKKDVPKEEVIELDGCDIIND